MELLSNFLNLISLYIGNVDTFILTIISTIIIIVLSIENFSFASFDVFHLILILYICLLIILSLFLCHFYSKLRKRLKTSELYNKTLYDLNSELSSFKHDINNIHISMSGYIDKNDMVGLKKFCSDFHLDNRKINNLNLLSPDLINDNAIFSLLSTKYYEAESKGITVNLYFFLDLSEVKIKIYELARILGILLDNAIDAASESKEKFINITFRRENNRSRDIVVVENSYADKDLNVDEIFLKGVSHKENHSGLGLWEVRKILSRHNNLNLYTNKTESSFTQQLEIYYEN